MSAVADAIIANHPSFAHVHCAQALGVPVREIGPKVAAAIAKTARNGSAPVRSLTAKTAPASDRASAVRSRAAILRSRLLTWFLTVKMLRLSTSATWDQRMVQFEPDSRREPELLSLMVRSPRKRGPA